MSSMSDLEYLGSEIIRASEDTERVKALGVFNKVSGAPIVIMQYVDPTTLNNDDYSYVEVEASITNDTIVGDIDNFEIVGRDEAPPIVYERAMNQQATDRVTKEYPLVAQINILRDVVTFLTESLEIEGKDEHPAIQALKDMNDYIADVLEINTARKAYYAESDAVNYMSSEDEALEFERATEGAIREQLGYRTVGSGDRIFY